MLIEWILHICYSDLIKSTAMQVFISIFSSSTSTVDEILRNAATSSCFSYLDQYLCLKKSKLSLHSLVCSVYFCLSNSDFLDTHCLFYSIYYAVVERL